MDQSARMASLDAFKNGAVDILVCSDVAARGLDIPDVSHVVNFDVPTHSEDYVHRIGRTGRAGRSGVSLTIVTSDDGKYIAQIEDLIKRKIDWLGPKVEELGEAQYTERDRERSSRGERSGASSRRGGRAPSAGRGPRPERVERSAPVERAQPAERAQPVERAERPHRAERAERSPRVERAERPQPAERTERPQPVEAEARAPRQPSREHEGRDFSREPQRPRRAQKVDNDPPVIGLGDHVPSFLLRPVRLKGAKPVE
jgi:superfamily II DNA/RNA helicase